MFNSIERPFFDDDDPSATGEDAGLSNEGLEELNQVEVEEPPA